MEKYEQFERVFSHFDSNNDGKISPEELCQCVADMAAEEAEAAVALMDSDGDGLLSLEDFVKIVEGAGEEERQSDLMAAFKLYAPEGSSCITAESLKRMLSRLGERRSVHDCKNMIATFDLNGDGVLNFDEFKIMMSSAC
ncbi:hypothetical protein SASPL_125325 [Salvia splendens]|uniref:EF-hand domain-containing protein n=1 Tax=Salvia splendens TaxID=180675 RepID=A0A8X8XGY0_SALSN|nr:calcium-binding protein CML38-like [Salvia splendens]KAG6412642.1 hypothetical protein SASPL_125325 [Salvia splendens]